MDPPGIPSGGRPGDPDPQRDPLGVPQPIHRGISREIPRKVPTGDPLGYAPGVSPQGMPRRDIQGESPGYLLRPPPLRPRFTSVQVWCGVPGSHSDLSRTVPHSPISPPPPYKHTQRFQPLPANNGYPQDPPQGTPHLLSRSLTLVLCS